MAKFRILIVTFTFPPNKDGVSEIARAMAESFVAHGHSVQVATEFSPERKSEIFGNGILVKQFRIQGSPNWRDGIRGEIEAFKEFVAAFQGDFLICHGWHTWSSDLAEAVFSKLNCRKIMMSHGFAAHLWVPQRCFPWGFGYWLGWQPWLWSFPVRLRKYDHLVVNSSRVNFDRFLDGLIAKCILYRNVSVIANGADPQKFDFATDDFRKKHGLEGKLLFLDVANYSDRKNQEFAVRAFARANLQNASLVFIGSEFNDYSKHVECVARRLDLSPDRVLFLERVNRELTFSAFHGCDVFVLSAKAETQPVVIIEAMTCAKPWVSTATGCVRDFPGGYVVRNINQMAQRFRILAADPKLRATLGAAGRKACLESYTWEKVGQQWEALLAKLSGATK